MTPTHRHGASIFVSYSRKDAVWLERLRPFLEDLRQDGSIDYFDDTQIASGTDWRRAVAEALDRATAAILLVSQSYLASPFIRGNELPPLLEAAEKRGCRILPVVISPCTFLENQSISRFQAVNDPERPLTRRGAHYREVFVKLVREIRPLDPPSTAFGSEPADPERYDVYLSLPMSSLAGEEYLVMRQLAERVVTSLFRCGYKAYCGALLVEQPRRYSVPRTGVRAWKILDRCRCFVLIYPAEVASSVLVEAGYALKQGTPSVYIVRQDVNLPYMLDISNKLDHVDILEYSDVAELEDMILNHCRSLLPIPTVGRGT